jgi:hypothetical protein
MPSRGAASPCLKALYPRYVELFDDSLVNGAGASFAYGEQVAAAMVLERSMDGAAAAPPPAAPSASGTHQTDPFQPGQGLLGAHWGEVAHLVGPRTELDDFPGQGSPNFLADPHYRQDLEEVRSLGAIVSAGRTAEQKVIGTFWAYDGAQGIGLPPRLYNQIARRIALSQGLNLAQAVELFAEINVAMADAGIDAWHPKYVQNLWRPVIGIRGEGPPDGDAFWAPLGAPQTNRPGAYSGTPPFPAYTSGHATFGAAIFQVLRLRSRPGAPPIGVQEVLNAAADTTPVAGESFTFVSDELDGRAVDADGSVRTKLERPIASHARAIWENAISRVYIGVHWRFDGLPRDAADPIGGVPLGLEIGRKVHQFFAATPSLGGP